MFSTMKAVGARAPQISKRIAASRNMTYKAPVKDVKFLLDKVFKVHELFPQDIAPPETVDVIIGEIAKFSSRVLFYFLTPEA